VYDSCAKTTRTQCEQFLNLHVGFGLDFIFMCLIGFSIFCVS